MLALEVMMNAQRNRGMYPQTSLSVTASVPMRRQAQRSSQRNGTSVVTEMKSRQAAKIRELGQSLIDAGFVKAQYRRLTEGVAKKREGFVGEGVIRLASRPRRPHVRTSFGKMSEIMFAEAARDL